jgi:membrane-bound lytic murein transglycosylase A
MNLLKKCTLFLLLAFLPVLFNGCAKTPLNRLAPANFPVFLDDSQNDTLLTGAVRHLHYLNKLPSDSLFTFGSDSYPISHLRDSMNSFIDILKQDPAPEELARIIAENYTAYQAGGRKDYTRGEMLFTGYYEPFLQGSLTKKAPYLYPLYSPPPTLLKVKSTRNGKMLFKRRDQNNQLQPYWTRKEIEKNDYAAGSELVYIKDPVDAFILHIQGSGKIQLTDGSIRSIHYAASNGLEYFSIGKLLVEQGKISLEEASIPTIRAYLVTHPDEQDAILYHNSKFIFFNWAPAGDPVGSIGEPLVAGRSIAIDPDVLPQQTFAFLLSKKPELDNEGNILRWVSMQRFVFPQDTGSAIKGAGRADIYWGNSSYAKTAAGSMKEKGTLYFLVKNNFEKQKQ